MKIVLNKFDVVDVLTDRGSRTFIVDNDQKFRPGQEIDSEIEDYSNIISIKRNYVKIFQKEGYSKEESFDGFTTTIFGGPNIPRK